MRILEEFEFHEALHTILTLKCDLKLNWNQIRDYKHESIKHLEKNWKDYVDEVEALYDYFRLYHVDLYKEDEEPVINL